MRAPSARAKRPTHRAAKPHHASPLVAHVRATKRRGPQLGGTGASGYEAKLTPPPPTVPPAGGDVGQAPPPVVHSTAAGPPRSVREVVVLFAGPAGWDALPEQAEARHRVEARAYDVVRAGPSHDLTRDEVCATAFQHVTAPACAAVWAAPPCASYSRARGAPGTARRLQGREPRVAHPGARALHACEPLAPVLSGPRTGPPSRTMRRR